MKKMLAQCGLLFALFLGNAWAAEVEIEETPLELQAKGGGEFTMHFKDFPVDEDITMTCAHVIQKHPGQFKEVEKFTVDANGDVWIKGSLVSAYTFGAEGIAKGERVKYKFLGAEGALIAESSFIPYPLVIHGKKKTFRMEMEMVQLDPTEYLLTFQGLKNGERMRIRANFGRDDEEEEDFFYRSKPPRIYRPGIVGQEGGYALLDIMRLSGDSIKVQVPWGMEVLRRVAHLLPDAPELQKPAKKPKPFRSR